MIKSYNYLINVVLYFKMAADGSKTKILNKVKVKRLIKFQLVKVKMIATSVFMSLKMFRTPSMGQSQTNISISMRLTYHTNVTMDFVSALISFLYHQLQFWTLLPSTLAFSL